jgi:hypothetical protein
MADKAGVAGPVVESITAELRQSLLAGVTVGDYVLKPGRRMYRWKDPKDAEAALQEIVAEGLVKTEIASVAQVREMLARKCGYDREQIDRVLDPLVEQTRAAPSIVKAETLTDPSPDATLTVNSELAQRFAKAFRGPNP